MVVSVVFQGGTVVFFFNDPATPEIYTLSLHDALPILVPLGLRMLRVDPALAASVIVTAITDSFGFFFFLGDRKSTRLNSSHANISYAVFCLKKKTHARYRTLAPNDDYAAL